jgi:FKBP-type peptidyl-prolyl cis-trans isomerase SlyD
MSDTVTRIEDGKLTVDANHPLAGQTVKFIVTIVGVRPATLDEIANGIPADGGDGGASRLH